MPDGRARIICTRSLLNIFMNDIIFFKRTVQTRTNFLKISENLVQNFARTSLLMILIIYCHKSLYNGNANCRLDCKGWYCHTGILEGNTFVIAATWSAISYIWNIHRRYIAFKVWRQCTNVMIVRVSQLYHLYYKSLASLRYNHQFTHF
jgi:hypothetical protein